MTMTSTNVIEAASVNGSLGYLVPQNERPYNYMYPPPDGGPWQNCHYEMRQTTICDARAMSKPPTLATAGFELARQVTVLGEFSNKDLIEQVYYPEMAELALNATGGKRAYVFDHLVRRREEGRPQLTFGRQAALEQPAAVGRVHTDYTADSGRARLAKVITDSDERAAVNHYCIVNIWRSVRWPVVDTPLAICDGTTASVDDAVTSEVRYPNRNGEIYLFTHNANHRWYYFSEMTGDEALIFKQYDSSPAADISFTPHCAFDLPSVPPDAPLRHSIEVRVLVVLT